jgi:hypothetical protein
MSDDLKFRLVETLKYPRYLIRAELKLEDCPHDGHLNRADSRCRECLDNGDCAWLYSLEDEAGFADKPLDQLVNALGYAIESIECLLLQVPHPPQCQCEACLWHKQADSLYGEARCHPDLGAPPKPH